MEYNLTASQINLVEITRLVNLGYNPDRIMYIGLSLVNYICSRESYLTSSEHPEILKYLLTKGANTYNCLFNSVGCNNKGITTTLLECGVDVNHVHPGCRTFIQRAAHNKYYDMVSILIKYGADVHLGSSNEVYSTMQHYMNTDNRLNNVVKDALSARSGTPAKNKSTDNTDLNKVYEAMIHKNIQDFISNHIFEVEI